MPNIKSAMKRVKVTEKKNLRNRMVKTRVKTAVKKFHVALSSDGVEALTPMRQAASALDKAVAKGVIHKNTASRKKARMAKAAQKAAV